MSFIKTHENAFCFIGCNITTKIVNESIKKELKYQKNWSDATLATWKTDLAKNGDWCDNFAVKTGKVSGITVIDFDTEEGYEDFCLDVPDIKEYFTVKTRKGYHVYCKYDNRFSTNTNVMECIEGIDIRNDGGVIICPPSSYICPDGSTATYEFLGGKIREVPEFLFANIIPSKLVKEKPLFTPPSTPAPCDNITEEQIEILDNIDNEYWSEYSTWRDLVWAIKNTFGESSFEIAKRYSQRTNTNNYDEDALLKKLDECNDTRISWGTIAFYSKKSNLKNYEKIIAKYKKIQEDELKKLGKELLIKSIQIQKKDDEPSYEDVKIDFEKKHAKIVNKSLYICKTDDDVIMFLESKLITSFRHIKYYEPEIDKKGSFTGMKECSFIKRWIEDGKINCYDDMGLYPPPLKCPDNIYNLWQPFWISKLTDEYKKDEDGLDMFKNHIKILCNHDKNVTDYIIKWFAQMFQFPATKTIVPTFISEEGTGKGSVLELMGRMMGNKKTLVTTTPSRDVWGSFNSLMSDCFFVNLNEMSKKETMDAEGKIKGLITDPQLTINPKGISPYLIFSCHRFIITTQSEEPVKTKNDDRRNLIIRSSDEKALKNEENGKYFEKLREKLEDINVMRTIYDYFMSIEGLEKFVSIPIPKTEWQNDMKDSNRSPFCRWIESYIREQQDSEENPKLLGEDQYKLFKTWINANGIIHDTSSVKMAIAIKRLNIDGIETGVKGRNGNYTIYNIEKLKKHYMIGCQI